MTGTSSFEMGQVVMTSGVHEFTLTDASVLFGLAKALSQHRAGQWGEVDEEDKQSNDRAVENGDRILSAYTVCGKKVWVITEADRSHTTVLFPDEY